MKKVYLAYVQDKYGNEPCCLGIFSSREKAQSTWEKIKDKYDRGVTFYIDEQVVDEEKE